MLTVTKHIERDGLYTTGAKHEGSEHHMIQPETASYRTSRLLTGVMLAFFCMTGCGEQDQVDIRKIVATMPEKLPAAVNAAIGAVALHEVVTPSVDPREREGIGTAVHIGNGDMLTARHTVAYWSGPRIACGDVWLSILAGEKLFQDVTDKADSISTPVQSVYDSAIIHFGSDSRAASLPSVRVAGSTIFRPGQTMYTAGYPTPRDPRSSAPNHRLPVKMGVVVLGPDSLQSNSILAFTGLRSFERPPGDIVGGPGLSGAPVFNAEGEVTATVSGDTDLSVKDSERVAKITIKGAPPTVKVIRITPISQDSLDTLSHTEQINPCDR
ncbi:MAG TPA: serine protease [Candidatus Saccharimonadales bacterium]|nr:serine protease [Candidatus Saccharimonadales bacterium]